MGILSVSWVLRRCVFNGRLRMHTREREGELFGAIPGPCVPNRPTDCRTVIGCWIKAQCRQCGALGGWGVNHSYVSLQNQRHGLGFVDIPSASRICVVEGFSQDSGCIQGKRGMCPQQAHRLPLRDRLLDQGSMPAVWGFRRLGCKPFLGFEVVDQ